MAASPVLAEGNVILLIDTPEQAYLAAFDARRAGRRGKTERRWAFWLVLDAGVVPAAVAPRKSWWPARRTDGISGAKTGERMWWVNGVTVGRRRCPSPGDAVFTTEPLSGPPQPSSKLLTQYDKTRTARSN